MILGGRLARLGSGCYCLTKPLLADIFSENRAAGEVVRHCAVRGDILRLPPPVKFRRRLKCSAGPSGESGRAAALFTDPLHSFPPVHKLTWCKTPKLAHEIQSKTIFNPSKHIINC